MIRTLLPLAVVLLAGCTNSRHLAVVEAKQDQIDSLRVANYELKERLRVLGDSLQFYDAIDSGYYYRERRLLEDRITKLEYDLAVVRDGGTTVATLAVDDLFEPGTATLTEAGRTQLDALAEELQADYGGRVIRVEGHSDAVPLGPNLQKIYPSNWELSGARATAVVRYLTGERQLAADRFEAVAYGAARPVGRNDTDAGRRQNRRVRVAAF